MIHFATVPKRTPATGAFRERQVLFVRMRAAFQRATIVSVFLAVSAAAAVAADLSPIKLKIAGKEASLKTPALFDGREVYIPLESLKFLGAGYRVTRKQDAAEIFPANLRGFEIGLTRLNRILMAPLSSLSARLDAEVSISDELCDVRARIRGIEFGEDAIRLTTTFPVPVAARVKNGAKTWVTISITGAAAPIGHDTLKASWGDAGVTSSKVEQTEEGVLIRLEMERGISALPGEFDAAREHVVLLERRSPPALAFTPSPARSSSIKLPPSNTQKPNLKTARSESSSAGTSVRRTPRAAGPEKLTPGDKTSIKTTESVPRAPRSIPRASVVSLPERMQDPELVEGQEPQGGSGEAPAGPPRVTDVSISGLNPAMATLRIATVGKVEPVFHLANDPVRLVIDLPSCALPDETIAWPSSHALVSGVHVGESEAPGVSRLVVALNRTVGYRLVQGGPDGLTITLAVPRAGTGKSLRDIVIVVDPGHGGDANGCTVKAGGKVYNEKTITLSISRKLRSLLEEAGANVIMTRNADNSVGLYDRSGLANDNNANLFVSIHVDWISRSGPRGHTVYHHMNSSASRQLGKMVVSRMAEVSGIPSRGVVSDGKLYSTGLAVLRTSAMPAILVETGFLSNSADRQKLIDERWHQVMAEAIFSGIRDYVEGPQGEYTSASN